MPTLAGRMPECRSQNIVPAGLNLPGYHQFHTRSFAGEMWDLLGAQTNMPRRFPSIRVKDPLVYFCEYKSQRGSFRHTLCSSGASLRMLLEAISAEVTIPLGSVSLLLFCAHVQMCPYGGQRSTIRPCPTVYKGTWILRIQMRASCLGDQHSNY